MAEYAFERFAGINNILAKDRLVVRSSQTSFRYVHHAVNVDVTNSMDIKRRDGYSSLLSGNIHSLWSGEGVCLFREGDKLKRLMDDMTTTVTLHSGIIGNLPMSYCGLNGLVYYSDGVCSGVVEQGNSRSWGLVCPAPPAVAVVNGVLKEGSYRIVLTYVRNDGQESGTSDIVEQYVNGKQGIVLSVLSSLDEGVSKIRVYMSRRNSELFYLLRELSNINSSVLIYDDSSLSAVQCRTMFLQPMPPGINVAYFKGRIYSVYGDTVFYTEPFRYELVDMGKDFFQFGSNCTMLAPVDEGIYFGTDYEVIFLYGGVAEKAILVKKMDTGVVAGTSATFSYVGTDGAVQNNVVFLSGDGICIGDGKGNIVNVTKEKYVFSQSKHGVSTVDIDEHLWRYLVVVEQKGSILECRDRIPLLAVAGTIA